MADQRTAELRLDAGDGHNLYVAEAGSPDGIPAVFLHGGPGSGCQPGHADLFDRRRFRVVLPDQRGAGRSTPKGRLDANTTAHLIADLERIRAELGIRRWMVVGGSWGATLGIAYAEAHPDRVSAMVLRAVFLGTAAELHWAFGDGPRTLRPDLWAALTALLPADERDDPMGAFGRRLRNPDPAVHAPAACVWGDFERTLSEINPARAIPLPQSLDRAAEGREIPSTPYVENHYFRNDCFLGPDQLLAEAGKLGDIPAVIVQGRYDLLCPPRTSAALAAAWPGCEVRIVEGAGHTMSDPGVEDAVREAIRDLADRIADD
ncbi:MAG: prolyl aminopeptidase [Proteobacteria bacterium]|nr:prolyl aminopeptidase [Pseudomonadota bacterium]